MSVALVNMPFAPATRPSIQIGLLRGLLDEAGLAATEHHAAMRFYDRLRQHGALSQYTALSPSMVSEWYFSSRPFDPDSRGPDAEAVQRLESHGRSIGFGFERMLDIRGRLVPQLLDETAEAVAAANPAIVAFTLSYAQLNASFALAERIKRLLPRVVTLFGGAGSQVYEEACREYMAAFPAIDMMVLGDAEPVFTDLVRHVLEGRSPHELANVMYRRNGAVVRSNGDAPPSGLDASPTPRYAGWFEARAQMPMETRRDLDPVLLMELGRGCTWGDERTCSFCAFIFHGRYRGKSRERILEEVAELARLHRRKTIYLVDDIVTNAQITDVLPAMRQAVPGLLVQFMEMRTATTRRHVQSLAASGVCLVQPGTECFDDGLLKKISKGTTTFHNVQFLKWARELGVRVSHNVLLEVPRATRDEVEGQLKVLRQLFHLDPPFSFPLQLVRFSPYHAAPAEHGLGRLVPDPFYRWIFPESVNTEAVAYEFVEEGRADPFPQLHEATSRLVGAWQLRWSRLPFPFLVHERDGDEVRIVDGRDLGPPLVHRLDARQARVHQRILDCPMNEEGIARVEPDLPLEEIRSTLDHLVEIGVALHLRGRWLSLACDAEAVRRWQELPALTPSHAAP